MNERKQAAEGGDNNKDLDKLTALTEQTTQSACSAVLLTARELIKSHNQKFAIDEILDLSKICENAAQHLENSRDELDLNNQESAYGCLNKAIDSLMNVSTAALSADVTATNLASNDTALFRGSRK